MTEHSYIGQKIDSYTIESVIGRGSVAVVYRALTPTDTVVALKLFSPPPNGEEKLLLARFEREARLAAGLDHPNIVSVLDMGEIDGRAYMVMPFAGGETLDTRLRRKLKLSELTSVEIAWQVADALAYAHRQGIVHRDVKPSNILLSSDDHAMLTDFGVAQAWDDPSLTKEGHIVGTPAYMAPEQVAQGGTIDHRADLYSLGVVLYRMATGRTPFRGTTPQMLHAHIYEKPPTPSSLARMSPETETIILRAMAKNPRDRYPDGEAMTQALARTSYHLRNRADNRSPWQSMVEWIRSRLYVA
ncbi:MAG: serine/threonine protein kinase [Anaerolineae bacterium]|nr:serine/threonine protein kinase [Anaerolineae bacterium]